MALAYGRRVPSLNSGLPARRKTIPINSIRDAENQQDHRAESSILWSNLRSFSFVVGSVSVHLISPCFDVFIFMFRFFDTAIMNYTTF
jgi:hypothetical protein